MTKDELIEAMKDFPGDMKVQVKAFNHFSDKWDIFDVECIHKLYDYGKDILLIRLDYL